MKLLLIGCLLLCASFASAQPYEWSPPGVPLQTADTLLLLNLNQATYPTATIFTQIYGGTDVMLVGTSLTHPGQYNQPVTVRGLSGIKFYAPGDRWVWDSQGDILVPEFDILDTNAYTGGGSTLYLPSSSSPITPITGTIGTVDGGQNYTNVNSIKIGSSKFQIDSTGTPKKISNITAADIGTPVIVDYESATAKNGQVSPTNFTGSTVTGLYRVSWYIVTSQASGSATVTATIVWTDIGGSSESTTSSTINLGGYAGALSGSVVVASYGTGGITYSTTVSGTQGSGRYAYYFECERLH